MSGYLRNLAREARRRGASAYAPEPRPVRDPVGLFDLDARIEGTLESTSAAESIQDLRSRVASDAVDRERRSSEPKPPQGGIEREVRFEARETPVRSPIPVTVVSSAPPPVEKIFDSGWPAAHPAEIAVSADTSPGPRGEIPAPSVQPWPAERAAARAEWISVAAGPAAQPLAALGPANPGAPDIHVSIGRIEVSAVVGAPAARVAPVRQTNAMSLAQYEAKRREGSR